MTYESELNALKTAFFQRQNRVPNQKEFTGLQIAARESVYGPPVTCGHQLTEYEHNYYDNHTEMDRMCKRCVMEGKAR